MGYEQTRQVQLLTSGGNDSLLASGTGAKARFPAMYSSHVVKAVSIVPLTTLAIVTAPIWSIRVVTGGNGPASTTGQEKSALTMATGANQGKIRTRDKLNIDVPAGQLLELNVKTAATEAMACRASILVEPDWDTVANATGFFTSVTA